MRLRRMRLWLAIGAGCAVAAATAGVVTLTDGDAPAVRVQQATASETVSVTAARDVESYWTSSRMAAAAPAGRRSATSGSGVSVQGATQTATAFGGIPTVGALFFNTGSGDRYCTASVIASRSLMLVITAAHCIHGGAGRSYYRNIAFVPKYDRGTRPYGVWAARRLFVDRRWATRSDIDLDYGFISLHPRNGRKIQNVVGANKLAINKGYVNTVNVVGYPNIWSDTRNRPIWCRTRTSKQSTFQIRMACNGFYGGTSGSPWLLNYSSTTRTGYINGVLGGYQGGGIVHWLSYAAYFDQDVVNLRAYASSHA